MMLLGATFTNEYAIGAALQPQHGGAPGPDRIPPVAWVVRDERAGSVRVTVPRSASAPASSTPRGQPRVDDPVTLATVGTTVSTLLEAEVFRLELTRLDDRGEGGRLRPRRARRTLHPRRPRGAARQTPPAPTRTRGHAQETIGAITAIAERSYGVEFDDAVALPERVLWPAMQAEAAGMEDAVSSASPTTTVR